MTLPGFFALASLNLGARTVPIVASVVLHAGIAAGLVATAPGHGRARTAPTEAVAEMTVDVDAETPVETPAPLPAPVAEAVAAATPSPPPPTHTHPYPVDESHDARPHDPSAVHEHDEHAREPAAPAAAAPALVAVTAAVLPRFDLGSGSGAPTGAHVAASATSTGSGAAGTSANVGPGAGSDDVVHSAAGVQVAARLVASVTAAYPVHARADEVEGDVGVEIVVDREGRVVDARVTRPAGHGFDDAALAAVRAYRFSPAQREGRAVRVRMPWSVQFRLR